MSMTDVIPALFMLVLSAIVVLATWSLGYWGDFTPGPAFAPVWIAAAGVILALLRLLEARTIGDAPPVAWPGRRAAVQIALTMTGLVLLVVLSPLVGMLPAVALFIAFFLLVIARRRLAPTLVAVAITTGFIYGVFVLWLKMRLPIGVLGI